MASFLFATSLLISSSYATVLKTQLPGGSHGAFRGPLVTSEALQATIQAGELYKRAEHLFQVANLSMDEYNHPTRVIGSAGRFCLLSC